MEHQDCRGYTPRQLTDSEKVLPARENELLRIDVSASKPCVLGRLSENLFVVDNTYEGHPNGRVIAFLADNLKELKGTFPDLKANKVYCVEKLDQTEYIGKP